MGTWTGAADLFGLEAERGDAERDVAARFAKALRFRFSEVWFVDFDAFEAACFDFAVAREHLFHTERRRGGGCGRHDRAQQQRERGDETHGAKLGRETDRRGRGTKCIKTSR